MIKELNKQAEVPMNVDLLTKYLRSNKPSVAKDQALAEFGWKASFFFRTDGKGFDDNAVKKILSGEAGQAIEDAYNKDNPVRMLPTQKKSRMMIKELTKIANELDSRGLPKEASALDGIIRMAADDEKEYTRNPDEAVHEESGEEEMGAHREEEEAPDGSSLLWMSRGQWESAKHDLRKQKAQWSEDTPLLERLEGDIRAIQSALDAEASPSGYLVINPWDTAEFRKYIQDQMAHPEGREIAVPLNTFEEEGKRVNFFKINDWADPKGDRFGQVETITE